MSEDDEPQDTDPATDREAGIYRGRSIARRFISPEGLVVLVGKKAADNDILSTRLGRPNDFWLHIASGPGSHVVVLNPEGLERMPKDTERFAAALAAGYSKASAGGQVAVHVATVGDVSKSRGAPTGQVSLRRSRTVHARPLRE